MSEDDDARDGAGASLDVRERLGGDFVTRLASSLAMGVVVALFTFTGMVPFAVLVVAVTMVLSWEWGRLVHGREADMAALAGDDRAARAVVGQRRDAEAGARPDDRHGAANGRVAARPDQARV